MPIPKVVARWNKAGLNKITRHIAPWMPGLAVVVHRGRRSGRAYETPVNVFADDDRYIIALIPDPGNRHRKLTHAPSASPARTAAAQPDRTR